MPSGELKNGRNNTLSTRRKRQIEPLMAWTPKLGTV